MARVVLQVQSVHHVQRRQVSRTGDSTRTDGHDTLGRTTDPGLVTPVPDFDDADGGSGRRENVHGQRCSVGTADSRVRDNVKRNVP